jgi:chromosome segregation ATPase
LWSASWQEGSGQLLYGTKVIEQAIYFALGFIVAALLALAILPAFWRRAYRLTRRDLEAQLPVSPRDIAAERDQLRAKFAVERRQLELAVDEARADRQREMGTVGAKINQIADRNTELEVRAGQLAKLSDDLAGTREKLGVTTETLRDTAARLASAESELAALSTRYHTQEAEKSVLAALADEQRFSISALNTNMEAQVSRIADLDRAGKEARAELAQRKDELRATDRAFHDSEKDRFLALRKLESAEEISERRAGLLVDRDATIASLKEKGAELYKSVKQLEAALKSEARRGTTLQKQVDDAKTSGTRLRDDARQTASELTASIERLRSEKAQLQTDLTDARARAAQVQRELTSLQRAAGATDLRPRAPRVASQK